MVSWSKIFEISSVHSMLIVLVNWFCLHQCSKEWSFFAGDVDTNDTKINSYSVFKRIHTHTCFTFWLPILFLLLEVGLVVSFFLVNLVRNCLQWPLETHYQTWRMVISMLNKHDRKCKDRIFPWPLVLIFLNPVAFDIASCWKNVMSCNNSWSNCSCR